MRSPQIVHDETDLHVPPGEPRDHVEPRHDCESDFSSSCCDVESQPGHILKMLKQAPGESAAFKLIHHNDGKTEAIKFPVVCAPVTVPGLAAVPATMPAAARPYSATSKSFNTIIGIANWFGVTPKTIYSWRKTDSSFAPRIGLAYRVPFSDPHYQKRAREFSSDK